MPIGFRLLFYACLGVAAEVVFTAVCARFGLVVTADLDDADARSGWRLKGHSFAHAWRWVGRGAIGGYIHLAMALVWFAAALALEPLHDLLVDGAR